MRNLGVLLVLVASACGAMPPGESEQAESGRIEMPALRLEEAGLMAKAKSKPTPDLGVALCCGTVVAAGSGWSWSFEDNAEKMACRRAIDDANYNCEASSLGQPCCDLQKTCDCIDYGSGWSCGVVGYLQYACF